MSKKNIQPVYISFTDNLKKHLAEKIVIFALGFFASLVGTFFTVLTDHQRVGALEENKADKRDIEIIEYKLDLLLNHFDIKFQAKE